MTTIHTLDRTLTLPRPIDEIFCFFEDAMNLEKITPEFLGFRVLTEPPIEMGAGTLIDYRIQLFGIPMRWRTLIESYDSPNMFVDTQIKGPYKLWHHTHRFRPVPNGTEMIDSVRYQIGFGPFGELAQSIFVKRTLKRIFDYRNQRITELLG